MHVLSRLLVGALIAIGIAAPAMALAAIIPIGGKVTSVWPCLNGGIYFTVVGAGIGSGAFTFMPGSIMYPWGPPRPAVNVLGTADVPYPCVISVKPPIVFPSLRVFMTGTSLSI
jgi:hypothetical protein